MPKGLERGARKERFMRASVGHDGHVASVVAQDSTGLTLLNPHNNVASIYPFPSYKLGNRGSMKVSDLSEVEAAGIQLLA